MHEKIIQMLRQNNSFRDWNMVLQNFRSGEFKLKIAGHINSEPIYEFFNTYSDNFGLNSSSITISVQPVKSYIPFHIHNYVEIKIPLVGNCVVVTEHERIKVKQDNMIFIGIKTLTRLNRLMRKGSFKHRTSYFRFFLKSARFFTV
ncbi:hypothetical protein SDC49_21600 [Lactobacillus sp. R2/2]|nr:hypothetical protein [Lactobacillus sp. R2/2]